MTTLSSGWSFRLGPYLCRPLIKAMYAAAKNNHGTPSEQLGSLNNRFATYIEKVRYLEEQNKILEIKIKAASKRKSEIEKNEGKYGFF